MSPAQSALYFRRWGAVRKMLREVGEFSAKDADAERHVIHQEALGYERSSKDFTNRELDKVLAKFDERMVLFTGPIKGDRVDVQQMKRLVWSVEQTGYPDSYLNAIARDHYRVDSWRDLPADDMKKLLITAKRRAGAKKKKAFVPTEDEPF